MQYAQVTNSTPTELNGSDINVGDVQFSFATMLLLSDAERAGYGIYPITDDAIPLGQVSTGSTLAYANGAVARHWTLTAAPPPPVPQQVTAVQGSIALQNAGLYATVVADVAAADPATQIWFAKATTWERSNTILAALATKLGLSSAQVDALFVAAAAIN